MPYFHNSVYAERFTRPASSTRQIILRAQAYLTAKEKIHLVSVAYQMRPTCERLNRCYLQLFAKAGRLRSLRKIKHRHNVFFFSYEIPETIYCSLFVVIVVIICSILIIYYAGYVTLFTENSCAISQTRLTSYTTRTHVTFVLTYTHTLDTHIVSGPCTSYHFFISLHIM